MKSRAVRSLGVLICLLLSVRSSRAATSVAAIPAVKPNTFATVTVAGSHYDIGMAYGSTFGLQILRAMDESSTLKHMRDYVATPAGKQALEALTANVQASPMAPYLDEIKGIAEGAGWSYTDMLLFNMQDELGALAAQAAAASGRRRAGGRVDHCSDMLRQRADGSMFIAHNEDAGLSSYPNTYFADVKAPDVTFTAYAYPGALCSGAFGYNEHGLFYSTNAVFPKNISLDGVPRNFFHRYLITSRNISEAVERAQAVKVASGLSLNVGCTANPGQLFNIEISSSQVNPMQVTSYYAHFNMYLRLTVPQFTDISSVARLRRYKQLPPPLTVPAALNILGDTKNSSYPIYRNGAPPDGVMTLITAVFDSADASLAVYLNNPKTCTPLSTFAIPSPA